MVRQLVKRSENYEQLRDGVTLKIDIFDVNGIKEVYCAAVTYDADIMDGLLGFCIVQTPMIDNDAVIMKQILANADIVKAINALKDSDLERMDHDEWQAYYNPVG